MHVVVKKEVWVNLMLTIEATFGTGVVSIPTSVFEIKTPRHMMVQNSSTIPLDKANYATGPSAALSLEERMRCPPWQFTWWKELFENGMAQYFGVKTESEFSHIHSGVYYGEGVGAPFREIMEAKQKVSDDQV